MSIITIQKSYGFKSLNILKKLGGFSSENYLALADDIPVIIKYCSDKIKIQKAINIANLLLKQDLPVPTFLKSLQGTQYIKIQDKFVCLYTKIEGEEFVQHQLNNASFKSIAKSLAQIHSTECQLPPQTEITGDIDELIYLIQSNSKGSNIDKTVLDLIQTKQRIAEKLTDKHIKEYPKCLIHGDFHGQNLLFNPKCDLIGILDFEESKMGYKGEDVMHFILISLCYNGFLDQNMQKVEMFIRQCLDFMSIDELVAGFDIYLKKLSKNFYLEKRLYTKNDLSLLPFIKRDAKNLLYLSKFIHPDAMKNTPHLLLNRHH